ncbi:hypothetical protein [Actinacidiphila paucisporea]|uniref:hypothetical protein n=1 Tax=Actinacidiphila paucisporea TaxID=310782 RepID=UPI0011610AAD|nr:hypothetical protein [Actinacidiphila paucisporea]
MAGVEGEFAQVVLAEGHVGRRRGVLEGALQGLAGLAGAAVQLKGVGGAGEGIGGGVQVQHVLDGVLRCLVVAELGQRVVEGAVGRPGVRVVGDGPVRPGAGLGELVPGVGKSGHAGEGRGVVLRLEGERASQRGLGLGVQRGIARQPGLLDVGGAELGPARGVGGLMPQPCLERGDGGADGPRSASADVAAPGGGQGSRRAGRAGGVLQGREACEAGTQCGGGGDQCKAAHGVVSSASAAVRRRLVQVG